MKYPHLYVLITEKCSLPSLECLQAWSDSKCPIYVHGVSEPIFAVNTRINQIRKVHGYLHNEFCPNISAVLVFPVQEISTLLHLWLSSVDHQVYWLESAEVAYSLKKNLNNFLELSLRLELSTRSLSFTYDMAMNLFASISEAEHLHPTPVKEAITEYGISLDCRILDFFLETTRPGAIQCS